MQIAGNSSVLQQTLLAALPKVREGFGATAAQAEANMPQTSPIAIPGPATSVQMLVTLAASEPPLERRRKEAERADKGLSVLERLQAELVVGVSDPERLQELVEWLESFDAPEDPVLSALSREIELRVRVEAAKLEMLI